MLLKKRLLNFNTPGKAENYWLETVCYKTKFENQIGAAEYLSEWANNPLNSEPLGLTQQSKKLRNTNLVAKRINKAMSLKLTIGIYDYHRLKVISNCKICRKLKRKTFRKNGQGV